MFGMGTRAPAINALTALVVASAVLKLDVSIKRALVVLAHDAADAHSSALSDLLTGAALSAALRPRGPRSPSAPTRNVVHCDAIHARVAQQDSSVTLAGRSLPDVTLRRPVVCAPQLLHCRFH